MLILVIPLPEKFQKECSLGYDVTDAILQDNEKNERIIIKSQKSFVRFV